LVPFMPFRRYPDRTILRRRQLHLWTSSGATRLDGSRSGWPSFTPSAIIGLTQRAMLSSSMDWGGHWRETWATDPKQEHTFWPKWLADDIPQANVWSLEYEAHRSQWRGGMSLLDNADYVLELLVTKGLGKRPLFFIAHSLGGLLVKSLLRAGCDAPDGTGGLIASATRGVVFFATPNSGSRLASLIIRLLGSLGPLGQLYRAAPLVYELRAHTPELLRLNQWYRDNTVDKANGLKITTKVYYERHGNAFGFLPIVDESSADPGVAGIRPVPVPADHFSICKFAAQGDWLYESVRQFFKDLFSMEVRVDSPIAPGKIIELRLRGKQIPQKIILDVDPNIVGSENLTLVVRHTEEADDD
jgi:hypothetical protein